jgi:hypothetical protein
MMYIAFNSGGRIGFGAAVVISTVWSSAASTAVTRDSSSFTSEVLDRARFRLKTTSALVKGVPSWKRTPWRRSKRQVVGEVSCHAVASAGSIS